MKLFTLKDFIKYNNPCKSCDRKTEFYVKHINSTSERDDLPHTIIIKPVIQNGCLLFTLSTKYKSTLAIIINPITHKFTLQSNVSDPRQMFEEFKVTNYLYAESNCKNCGTMISSNFIEFDGNIIKPIDLFIETVHLISPTHKFTISTSANNNKTHIVADILVKATSLTPFTIEVPALPLSKFKDREALLKKLKMILTFS